MTTVIKQSVSELSLWLDLSVAIALIRCINNYVMGHKLPSMAGSLRKQIWSHYLGRRDGMLSPLSITVTVANQENLWAHTCGRVCLCGCSSLNTKSFICFWYICENMFALPKTKVQYIVFWRHEVREWGYFHSTLLLTKISVDMREIIVG